MIKVVDLFAGPGGLAEGFSRFKANARSKSFEVCVSAEKDRYAHATLRLRSFYRLCERHGGVPDSYYEYLRGERPQPYTNKDIWIWRQAEHEALQLMLGTEADDKKLARAIKKAINPNEEWVLIGGPPCQAYSIVGRARNKGIVGYRPENDHRHFLYREYLSILSGRHGPAVFVMENVKGILSAQVNGDLMFPKILEDLCAPGIAVGTRSARKYRIHSLRVPTTVFEYGQSADGVNPRDFVVRAEDYGVPQCRHRVILVGVRSDISGSPGSLGPVARPPSVSHIISGLPRLRSASSNRKANRSWAEQVADEFSKAVNAGLRSQMEPAIWKKMEKVLASVPKAEAVSTGANFIPKPPDSLFSDSLSPELRQWLSAPRLGGVVDHQTRPHMPADLMRYLFCAAFAELKGKSPIAEVFPPALAPSHKNWENGDFSDRFRVQVGSRPAATITSHISKDGHYFIHPSPAQFRSLTVREAARLQTFPDDYAFLGPRTAKFSQVGNAVPPLLATKIAKAIFPLVG